MGFHHLAFATNDTDATHRFYTEAMGFRLVKAVAAPTDAPGGWAKHFFYDTGDGPMIAFWELHDDRMTDFNPSISIGLGLEPWVNHVAFAARDVADLEARRQRWQDHGHDAMQIDHGFCVSAYTMDPNGILVEFCTDTAPYTDADADHALEILMAASPELETPPTPEFFRATHTATAPA